MCQQQLLLYTHYLRFLSRPARKGSSVAPTSRPQKLSSQRSEASLLREAVATWQEGVDKCMAVLPRSALQLWESSIFSLSCNMTTESEKPSPSEPYSGDLLLGACSWGPALGQGQFNLLLKNSLVSSQLSLSVYELTLKKRNACTWYSLQ